MATRLRAARNLTYPNGKSLKAVLAAGGLSQISKEEIAELDFKHVKAGSFCDFLRKDLPSSSVDALLTSGKVALVKVKPKSSTKKKGGK